MGEISDRDTQRRKDRHREPLSHLGHRVRHLVFIPPLVLGCRVTHTISTHTQLQVKSHLGLKVCVDTYPFPVL